MKPTSPVLILLEKVIATYIQAFVTVLIVSDNLDVSAAEAAAIAAIPAALTVIANGLPGVPAGLPFWVDLVYRTIRTYVVSFIGLLVAAPVFSLDLTTAEAAAIGAIPAALAVIKAGVASKVGDDDSASLLPSSVTGHNGPRTAGEASL